MTDHAGIAKRAADAAEVHAARAEQAERDGDFWIVATHARYAAAEAWKANEAASDHEFLEGRGRDTPQPSLDAARAARAAARAFNAAGKEA